jgi:hypothetical protein
MAHIINGRAVVWSRFLTTLLKRDARDLQKPLRLLSKWGERGPGGTLAANNSLFASSFFVLIGAA